MMPDECNGMEINMNRINDRRNVSMMMDLYELTMANDAVAEGVVRRGVGFDGFDEIFHFRRICLLFLFLQVWSRFFNILRICILRLRI